jgi:hypothetical protein
MFTREDYEKYFDQIARIERKMIYRAYDLGREVDDPLIVRILKKIGDDEVRHYGYVLKMNKIVFGSEREENRREPREYYLGTILLREAQDHAGREIKAYCVNLSKGGICLECMEDLLVGGAWNLEMRLFDKDEVMMRRGRVIWSKEVEPNFFISGIAFEV